MTAIKNISYLYEDQDGWDVEISDLAVGGNVSPGHDLIYSTATRIGRRIFMELQIEDIITTDMVPTNALVIRNLPYVGIQGQRPQGEVFLRNATFSEYVNVNLSSSQSLNFSVITLNRAVSGDTPLALTVADFASGDNRIIININYNLFEN